MRPFSRFAGLMVAGLLCTLPAFAQSASEGSWPAFGEVLDVRVVNLEAVVTERGGERVEGLGPEDFRLRVDGEEVPIEFFTEVRGGTAVAPSASTQSLPNPAIVPGEPLGTNYLVFVDEFFANPRDRDRVLERLAREIPYLGRQDRMAIVAWNGRELAMLQSWTGSPATLERVLAAARQRPAYGLQRLVERRQFELTTGAFRTRFASTSLELDERAYVDLLTSQLDATVDAANAALRGFANPGGRKVMLLLSGGWPFVPASYTVGNAFRTLFDGGVEGGQALYRPLVETANLLGYTLYPVDLPGFEAGSPADASVAFRRAGDGAANVDFYRESELHHSLQFLAGETGGRPLLNSGRDTPFSAVVSDTRSFYWLGFTPSWEGDDRRHRVTLELVRPGLKVRTRSGFSDYSRQSEVSMATESALVFGNVAAASSLGVDFGERSGWGKVLVPVTINVPLEDVAVLPAGSGYVAQLEVRIAARDDRGGRSDMTVIPVTVELASAPARGEVFTYETTVRLRRRPQDVIVSVFDTAGGTLLSRTTAL